MISVLSDSMYALVINILLKGLFIDVVIITFTEVSTNALDASMVDGVGMLDGDLIILIGAATMTSGFAV